MLKALAQLALLTFAAFVTATGLASSLAILGTELPAILLCISVPVLFLGIMLCFAAIHPEKTF